MERKIKTLFVTGATGMIGNGVVRALVRHNYSVLGLVRSEESAAKMRALQVKPLIGSLQDHEVLREGARSSDAVIHAAFIHDDATDLTLAATVEETCLRLFIEVNRNTGKPLIYTSGCAVFGSQPGHVTEDSAMNTPAYIAWRPALEQLVLNSEYGIVMRPNLVYGPGDRLAVPIMIEAARQRGASYCLGEGKNGFSTIHIDDVAEAYVLALGKAPPGSSFNLGAYDMTMRDLAEAIGRLIGAPERTRSISPEEALADNPYAVRLTRNLLCDSTRAREMLGWTPKAPSLLHEIEHGCYSGVVASP